MQLKRVRRLAAIAALAPLLLTACNSDVLARFDDVAGEYQLTVFAGEPVPATFSCTPNECQGLPNGGTFTAERGTIVLHNNGSFVETNEFTLRPPSGPAESDTFTSVGTYTVSGNTITFSAPAQNNNDPRFMDGTVEFDRIRYIENTYSYEYRR